MTFPRLYPVTIGLLTVARTTIVPIDAGRAPAEADTTPVTMPYAILHQIPSQTLGGPMADPFSFGKFRHDLWAVGESTEASQAALDVLLTALVGRTGGQMNVPWPTGSQYAPVPTEREFVGWGVAYQDEERRFAWSSAEIATSILT